MRERSARSGGQRTRNDQPSKDGGRENQLRDSLPDRDGEKCESTIRIVIRQVQEYV